MNVLKRFKTIINLKHFFNVVCDFNYLFIYSRIDCSLPDTYCSDGSTCLLVEDICDDKLDCEDEADEMNCTMNGTIPGN